MSTIFLIDDEKLPMDYYIKAFKLQNHEVKQFFSPDSVFEHIRSKKSHPDAILLDIMMLPGNKYLNEDTDDGLKTGILLYKDLREYYPIVPIIFLTNVSEPDIAKLPGETEESLKIIQKIDFPPFELVGFVENLITQSKSLEKA